MRRDSVFISYRREDSKDAAGRLAQALKLGFGENPGFGDDKVFFDTENIGGGERFPARLKDMLGRARVVLVVMGEKWLSAADKYARRRIDKADDWVRQEIATALAAEGVEVIPVLLDSTEMLPADALPDVIAALSELNFIPLRHLTFTPDAEAIAKRIHELGVPFVRTSVPPPREPEPRERLLRDYCTSVAEAHRQLPGLFSQTISDIDTVYVELDIAPDVTGKKNDDDGALEQTAQLAGKRGEGGLTLYQLLSRPPRGKTARRWVVLGEPGAGKSTLARHLARKLAEAYLDENAGAPGDHPIPVYATLPELATVKRHPLDFAEDELRAGKTDEQGAGLRKALEAHGNVWLLLDGFDEVPEGGARDWVCRQLAQWAEGLSSVTIALLSRPIGYTRPSDHYADLAHVKKLDDDKQRTLLSNWVRDPAKGESAWRKLQTRPVLREACRVPLLLSLFALLALREAGAPVNRRQLYHEGIFDLLERGHSYSRGGAKQGVENPEAALEVLRALSLELQRSPSESWKKIELETTLLRLMKQNEELALCFGESSYWKNPSVFLSQVSTKSNILAALDGTRAPWRFLHRQFRELLAAEALHARGPDAVRAHAQSLERTPDQVPRWAEVLGFACELSEKPLELLRTLSEADENLGLRVLPEVDDIDPIEALQTLRKDGKWDGDFLLGLFSRWEEQGDFKRENVAGWLWRQVSPERNTEHLAYLHYALETLEGSVDRARFFRACGRWPAAERGNWVRIPAGTFRMGSPNDEPERDGDEGPQHDVTLDEFLLAATAVTNAEYERFDPQHEREPWKGVSDHELDRHPVVNVSWWEAYLYCKWLGATLPTEAQWEYACRAGTTTPFSFGDNITPKLVNYNGKHPYAGGKKGEDRGRTVPVGSLPPNAWGLYEMHGNVYDWCQDWYVSYKGNPARPGDGLRGIHSASFRVLRGGSWGLLRPVLPLRVPRQVRAGRPHPRRRFPSRQGHHLALSPLHHRKSAGGPGRKSSRRRAAKRARAGGV